MLIIIKPRPYWTPSLRKEKLIIIRGMKLIDFSKLFPWSTTYTLTKKVQPFGTQYQGVIAILLLKDWGPWPPSNIFAIIKYCASLKTNLRTSVIPIQSYVTFFRVSRLEIGSS